MSHRRSPPPDCLALLAPAPEEIDLLRACLWAGAPARAAWDRWQQSAGDPLAAIRQDVSGVKSLLPLLHHALQRNGAATGDSLRHAIAAAYVAETLRWEVYAGVCRRAFEALLHDAIPFLVLKGAALAVSAYPEPALRHSHDIDVLVGEPHRDRAIAVLSARGFAAPQRRQQVASVRMRCESGAAIELHTRLYRLPYYATPVDVWARAESCAIGAARVRTLSRADHLVYVCGQASCCSSRDALKWIADAWFLAQDGDLAWTVVLRAACESRLAIPLAVVLRTLAVQLEVPVPPFVLDGLSAAAATANRAARDVAMTGLRAGRRGRVRDLFGATPSWRGRAALVRWLLLPSPAGLRLGEPLRYPRAWPAYYLARPVVYAVRRLASLVRRAGARSGRRAAFQPPCV